MKKIVEGWGKFPGNRGCSTAAVDKKALREIQALGYEIRNLEQLGLASHCPEIVPILLRVVRTSSDRDTWSSALDALDRPWVGPEVATTLMDVMDEADGTSPRSFIAQILKRIPSKHVMERLMKHAMDPRNGVERGFMLETLAKAKHPGTADVALAMLEEPDKERVDLLGGLNVLANLRDPRGRPYALQYLDHPVDHVRGAARRLKWVMDQLAKGESGTKGRRGTARTSKKKGRGGRSSRPKSSEGPDFDATPTPGGPHALDPDDSILPDGVPLECSTFGEILADYDPEGNPPIEELGPLLDSLYKDLRKYYELERTLTREMEKKKAKTRPRKAR